MHVRLSRAQVGDVLPSVDVQEGTPGDSVNVKELFAGKKGILFGVPGAFTPTCHKVRLRQIEHRFDSWVFEHACLFDACKQTHLVGYVNDHNKLKEKGVEVIACIAVNDAFVMSAWGAASGAGGKIRMLADTTATFTKVDLATCMCDLCLITSDLITHLLLTSMPLQAIDLELDLTKALGSIRCKRYIS